MKGSTVYLMWAVVNAVLAAFLATRGGYAFLIQAGLALVFVILAVVCMRIENE